MNLTEFRDKGLFEKFSDEDASKQAIMAGDIAVREDLPFIAAFVIAGDRLSAERSKRYVHAGLDAQYAVPFVGSYARLEFANWCVEQGHLDEAWLLDHLPDLWRGSDPDDTDPRWLALWQQASMRGGLAHTIFDETGNNFDAFEDWLPVYRGQLFEPAKGFGIAWSTRREVAVRFARTGGLRGSDNLGGKVYERWVNKADILAYLTLRHEYEVIVDPDNLSEYSPEDGAWLADGWLDAPKDDLTQVERDVLTALSGGMVTASAVTLAADLWQNPNSHVAWDTGDAVGFAAYVVDLLCEKGLLTYRQKMPQGPKAGQDERPFGNLPIGIRLTPAGWAKVGYPTVHPTVGSRLARSKDMARRPGDMTDLRNHSGTAQGEPIETLPIPMHRAKYPDHAHPPYYGEHPMSPDGRPYVKMTADMEAAILIAKAEQPTASFKDIAEATGYPPRTVRYVLTDLPRLRRVHKDEAKLEGSLKERIVKVLEAVGPVIDVPELRRILGVADDEHNIVHVLHSLKQQGRVRLDERGTGKGYANITLVPKRANGGAKPESLVKDVPERRPPAMAFEPEAEAPAQPPKTAADAPAPEPRPEHQSWYAEVSLELPGSMTLDDLDLLTDHVRETAEPTLHRRVLTIKWDARNLWDLRGVVDGTIDSIASNFPAIDTGDVVESASRWQDKENT